MYDVVNIEIRLEHSTCVAFDQSSQWVFIGDDEGYITKIDLNKGKTIERFYVGSEIFSLKTTSEQLLSLARGGKVTKFDLQNLKHNQQLSLPEVLQSKSVGCRVSLLDGIALVDCKDISQLGEREPADWGMGIFSSDGEALFIELLSRPDGYLDSQIKQINTKTGRIEDTLWIDCNDLYYLEKLAFSSNEHYLASFGVSYTFSMDWDPCGHHQIINISDLKNREKIIASKSLSTSDNFSLWPFGEPPFLITASFTKDEFIAYIDMDEEFTLISCPDMECSPVYMKQELSFTALESCSAGSGIIALGTKDGQLILMRLARDWVDEVDDVILCFKTEYESKVSKNPVTGLSFSPDGQYLAVIDEVKELQIFRLNDRNGENVN